MERNLLLLRKEVKAKGRRKKMDLSCYESLIDFQSAPISQESVHPRQSGNVPLKVKNISSTKQLKNLLELSKNGQGLTHQKIQKAVQLMSDIYISLQNKSYDGSLKEYENFLVWGEQLLDAIMKHPLKAIYSKEYVSLIKYLTDIGNTVYKTSNEKKRLLVNYDSFHTQMKELIKHRLLTCNEQISYHRTYIRILNAILTVTDDPLEQKKLLYSIIDRNQELLLVKKTIEDCNDITFLFNNYGRLYALEADNKSKFTLLEDALAWCGKLRKDYKMRSELRQFIRTQAMQYQEWKKDVKEVLSLGFTPASSWEMWTILPFSYTLEAVSNRETVLLPDFKPALDRQMLESFKLSL
ncbi:hypothetical protein [Candidatus Odyssella acanthamoebae]|nr:hypothetical protein [Candidatus Paracaedibacter acanthamoebae]